MKKLTALLAAVAFGAGVTVVGCSSSSDDSAVGGSAERVAWAVQLRRNGGTSSAGKGGTSSSGTGGGGSAGKGGAAGSAGTGGTGGLAGTAGAPPEAGLAAWRPKAARVARERAARRGPFSLRLFRA